MINFRLEIIKILDELNEQQKDNLSHKLDKLFKTELQKEITICAGCKKKVSKLMK